MLVFLLLAFTGALASAVAAAPPMSEPSLSPNHLEIAFVSGGDIWTVPSSGGEARLLVSNPATESRPLYSPDGNSLAFVSTRTGNGDIYVLQLKTGVLKRITFDDTRAALDAWSADSQFLYFSSNRGDIGGMNDLYKVPVAGGTPVVVAGERYVDESQAAPNPADGSVAFVNGNMAVTQWWRKGHAHIDETRIAIASGAERKTILENQARNLWPMWSANGRQLFFISDKSGVENVWALAAASGMARQVTHFTDGRLVWPGISADGKTIVFERAFRIWKLDPASGQAVEVEIALRGVPAGPSTTHISAVNDFRGLDLSADGKKIAFITHGEVFAASAKDGGTATRLTRTASSESDAAWSPDGNQLVYASDRNGGGQLFLYDIGAEHETQLTSNALKDEKPQWSPDGKQIAWIRDGREIHVMTIADKVTRVIASHKYRTLSDAQRPLSWSPDGQWIAFFSVDSRGYANVSVAPSAGGPARPISFLANSNAGGISWSPDSTYLLFESGQRTEQRSISRIDLIPRTPKFHEDQFRELFKADAPAPKPGPAPKTIAPVQIVFEGIRSRLTRLQLGLDANDQAISPDGKTLLFVASTGGQENLYTYSLDELATTPAVPRQLTSTAGRKSRAQFSPDGKEVFYLENGRINVIPVDTRVAKPLAVTAEVDVDFDLEKKEVFTQAWSILNEVYYDPKFHGADWGAMREKYAPAIEASRTPDEVRRVISLMIGEMNSSHSGISGGPAAVRSPATGRLGMTVDPADGTIRDVTPLGPADVAGIKAGEKLLSIDGMDFKAATNIDELLQYKIGRRTVVTTSANTGLALLPVNTATEKRLLYREWVEGRRAYVDKISGGRLGYVHMLDMSAGSLDQLYLDLEAENPSREGVVIDIRNNTGGFVNAYALDVFARRPYLSMTERDHPTTPARVALGQRSLELPTVLVVNQNSLSDAEDFTEGYRTLKLGKVIGVPTAGWIIYTGGETLIDGSALRTPTVKITANDGTDMELHPRPVDVEVSSPVGEGLAGHDAQLDAAVKTLLGEITHKSAGS